MPNPIEDELALIANPALRAARKALWHAEEPSLATGKTWQKTVNGHVHTLRVISAPDVASKPGVIRFRIQRKRDGVVVPWNDDGILEIANPYTKVEDPAGDIPVPVMGRVADPVTGKVEWEQTGVRMYREDRAAAMKEMVLAALKDALQ
jgi:hypothetical protein